MSIEPFAPSASWDLESLYPGGADGPVVGERIREIRTSLMRLKQTFEELRRPGDDHSNEDFARGLLELERLTDVFHDVESYAHCAAASDTTDQKAKELLGVMTDLGSWQGSIHVSIRTKLRDMSDESFEALVGRPDLAHMAFFLGQTRKEAEIMMEPELESLQEELARDGYHAWSRLYDNVSGDLRVHVDRGEGEEALSVEQARNLLSSTDPEFRAQVAAAILTTWDSQKHLFAAVLNHINGYRQVIYGRRGVDELEVPLRLNRIGRRTLETLFEVIEAFRPVMARFLDAKAKLLGLEKLRWFDLNVPVGGQPEKVSYEQAQHFVVRHFEAFSANLGEFARMAFVNRWIEAEDRSQKRHGGFCTGFPLTHQSRIFMTYGGTADSVQTLAHELGHAYHGWVIRDLPGRQREYPATLAETASTFAESIVCEAAYREASDDEVRLGMLDRKLTDAAIYTMNLPARFHFERAMYKQRASGELSPERLSKLILESFDWAYYGRLAQYDTLFWASKLHFHFTAMPFYNFPYTVGYLFSLGLFDRARQEGPKFAEKYRHALRLTGCHTVEEVASQVLGVDLAQPDFWQAALDRIGAEVTAFEAMTSSR